MEPVKHFFPKLLLMLYHRAVQHTQRKIITAHFHIHEHTDVNVWLSVPSLHPDNVATFVLLDSWTEMAKLKC